MTNARVSKVKVPSNTNVVGDSQHLHFLTGPYNIPAANTTIYSNMLCAIDTGNEDIAVHTSKTRPDGVVLWGYKNTPDFSKGGSSSNTPGHFKLLPSEVQVYLCHFGAVVCAIDQSDIADACYFGTPIYESAVAGLVAAPPSAAAYGETNLDAAGHTCIGCNLDNPAGNTGTGTGGADGDPIVVFLDCLSAVHIVST